MKCVLCINISRPESKLYEYITYWLIPSRIANCFELTATLTYVKREGSEEARVFLKIPLNKIGKNMKIPLEYFLR